METPIMLRRALELKCKSKIPTGWPRTRFFSQILEEGQKSGKNWKGIKRERKKEEIEDFLSTDA
jgi:hypothetical protein